MFKNKFNRIGLFSVSIFLITVAFFIAPSYLRAQEATTTPTPTSTPDNSGKASELQDKIKQLEATVSDLQAKKKSLSSEVAVMDNQIKLSELRINATESEITELEEDIDVAEGKISNLETSLDKITKVLLNRIIATYQVSSVEPIQVLMGSSDVSNFLSRANYLKIAQENDKKLMYNTVQAKNDYENQKNIFEDKKQKIEVLKQELVAYTDKIEQDKKVKDELLKITQNDEQKYQNLLAAERAEYLAIQNIVAGKGQEGEIGEVTQGQSIASVIQGASCNSGGTHLHFIVSRNGSTENPYSYLKSAEIQNCSGSSCNSDDGDPTNPQGSWDWPIDPPIKMSQGYGSTWATKNDPIIRQIYNFHNGIDISGASSNVKAVKDGTLFQGSYTGGGGCRLRYVRVHHNEDGLDTFYLHINYSL